MASRDRDPRDDEEQDGRRGGWSPYGAGERRPVRGWGEEGWREGRSYGGGRGGYLRGEEDLPGERIVGRGRDEGWRGPGGPGGGDERGPRGWGGPRREEPRQGGEPRYAERERGYEWSPGYADRMGGRQLGGYGHMGAEGGAPGRGRAPRTYTRSDERIREDIYERLSDQDWIDAYHVEVSVKGGEVTLEGTVETRRDKRGVEELAENVRGVIEVHNHLRLAKASEPQQPDAARSSGSSKPRPSS